MSNLIQTPFVKQHSIIIDRFHKIEFPAPSNIKSVLYLDMVAVHVQYMWRGLFHQLLTHTSRSLALRIQHEKGDL